MWTLSPEASTSGVAHQNDDKFRQLPCKTFICVGSCPYRDRCVYLHDPRLITRNAKTKTRRKNVDDLNIDSFFWPTMLLSDVRKNLDSSKQPNVVQEYNVPSAGAWSSELGIHDRAIYSMWMHFTEFCSKNQGDRRQTFNPDSAKFEMNVHSKKKRLRFLFDLSNGKVEIPSIERKKLNNTELLPSISDSGTRLNGVVFSVSTKTTKFETKTQRTVDIESPTTVANTEKEINGSMHSSSNLPFKTALLGQEIKDDHPSDPSVSIACKNRYTI